MEISNGINKKRMRYGFLDSIRGLVLISMILYHSCWDLVYLFDKNWDWYQGEGAYIWQQSICWSFILLSGFCWSLGKKHVKRGGMVFAAGGIISLVTILFMPENKVLFGVLTLIGSCMLLTIPVSRAVKRLPAAVGFWCSMVLFFLTRNINEGYLGFEQWNLCKLPDFMYQGSIMTFLGFPESGFYSTDYFSLFPWCFLYLAGYFIFGIMKKGKGREIMDRFFIRECPPLSFLGRHSLPIYMIHQPLIYAIFLLIF